LSHALMREPDFFLLHAVISRPFTRRLSALIAVRRSQPDADPRLVDFKPHATVFVIIILPVLLIFAPVS